MPDGYTAYGQTSSDLLVSTSTIESTQVIVPSDATSIDVYASDLTTQITDLLDASEAVITAAPVSGGVIQRFYAPDDYDQTGVWVESAAGWVQLPAVIGVPSGGGGSGTVTSVNGQEPDTDGNVDLGLATVATSGDYADLSNTPALRTVATSGDANDLFNMRSAIAAIGPFTVMYEYSGAWPTIPDAISASTQISKHFVGGSEADPPPDVSGTRIWDRPVA